MCLRPRYVHTVCSHTDERDQEDCTQVRIVKAAQNLGGFFVPPWMRSSCGPTWAQPICTTRVDYRLAYDFCPTCRALFAVYGELTEETVLRYWAYKNSRGMRRPVDPLAICPETLFGSPDGIAGDHRDVRLEMIVLSEALHMWDNPEEFKNSQAYGHGDGPLNLIEYLEEIRSTTLHRARRADHAPLPLAPRSDLSSDGGVGDAELASIRRKCGPVPRVPLPSHRPMDMTEGLSTTACATSSTTRHVATKVYEEDEFEEVDIEACHRSPKGKERARDFPPRGEYKSSESDNFEEQEYDKARQASVKQQLLDRMFSSNAGPSSTCDPLTACAYADGQSFATDSSDNLSLGTKDHGMFQLGGTVAHKPTLVVPARLPDETNAASLRRVAAAQAFPGHVLTELPVTSPVRSLAGVIETVSEDDGYQSDWEEYDSDNSPRRASAMRLQCDEVSSKCSSPLVSPVPASPDNSAAHRWVVELPTYDNYFRQASVFHNAPWHRGRPDDEIDPWILSAHSVTPEPNLLQPPTSHPMEYRPSDRPNSEVLPGTFSPAPMCRINDSIPNTAHPLPDLPVPKAENDALPEELARHMEDIDTLFHHQSQTPTEQSESQADSASPPSPVDRDDDYVAHNPHNPLQPVSTALPPLTAGYIANVARHGQSPSHLTSTSYAEPLPRPPPRLGTPPLAKTPSFEVRSLYLDAIRSGRCVLQTTPPSEYRSEAQASRSGRRSVVGLVLPALAKQRCEDAQLSPAPRSAPPFPWRVARPFEEIAALPVCLCDELGRAGCECPEVVEPVVWV
ncbi:hypothetical protein BR93DRAFT_968064 [Coniochaeta sp. PMI_546]|nr:hypothetical protein BR93DRAFT_968064 [Coniochaeta sp. PMI_546]